MEAKDADAEDPIEIIDLRTASAEQRRQAALLLVDAFATEWPDAWPTLGAAGAEVEETLGEGRVARAAVTPDGEVLGWIGGIPSHREWVWELHPLVVAPGHQRKGIGRCLVADLERIVSERGGITLYLGTDDESEQTTLGGADLYPGVLDRFKTLESRRNHPSKFYLRLGFEVVGVIPDANGFGKPDILMAKRVGTGRADGS